MYNSRVVVIENETALKNLYVNKGINFLYVSKNERSKFHDLTISEFFRQRLQILNNLFLAETILHE